MKAIRYLHRTLEVSCSLDARSAADRLAAWAALCEDAEREDLADGVRLWLAPTLYRAAIELADLESRCCPFLDVELALEHGRLRLDITSPAREAGPVVISIIGARSIVRPEVSDRERGAQAEKRAKGAEDKLHRDKNGQG
ncbi:MAG: hypothetical protein WB565_03085 [Acidimicrobiales bacterium]